MGLKNADIEHAIEGQTEFNPLFVPGYENFLYRIIFDNWSKRLNIVVYPPIAEGFDERSITPESWHNFCFQYDCTWETVLVRQPQIFKTPHTLRERIKKAIFRLNRACLTEIQLLAESSLSRWDYANQCIEYVWNRPVAPLSAKAGTSRRVIKVLEPDLIELEFVTGNEIVVFTHFKHYKPEEIAALLEAYQRLTEDVPIIHPGSYQLSFIDHTELNVYFRTTEDLLLDILQSDFIRLITEPIFQHKLLTT